MLFRVDVSNSQGYWDSVASDTGSMCGFESAFSMYQNKLVDNRESPVVNTGYGDSTYF